MLKDTFRSPFRNVYIYMYDPFLRKNTDIPETN